jgi:hypothetical protein
MLHTALQSCAHTSPKAHAAVGLKHLPQLEALSLEAESWSRGALQHLLEVRTNAAAQAGMSAQYFECGTQWGKSMQPRLNSAVMLLPQALAACSALSWLQLTDRCCSEVCTPFSLMLDITYVRVPLQPA